MAIDAALLELGQSSDRSVVRVYRWSEPTVTLGYFQAGRVDIPAELRRLPVVRRLTGGGAILHDQELTYSCVVPACHPWRHRPLQAYEDVHDAILRCLSAHGCRCSLRSRQIPSAAHAAADEPFLCFLRADPNDVVTPQGIKIVGSAQRRRRGTILQHGSVLLRGSTLTPAVQGVQDLHPSFDMDGFVEQLPRVIATACGMPVTERALTDAEVRRADQIEQTFPDR